jgi:hypothetical protein
MKVEGGFDLLTILSNGGSEGGGFCFSLFMIYFTMLSASIIVCD